MASLLDYLPPVGQEMLFDDWKAAVRAGGDNPQLYRRHVRAGEMFTHNTPEGLKVGRGTKPAEYRVWPEDRLPAK